jgi:hypothetical protein
MPLVATVSFAAMSIAAAPWFGDVCKLQALGLRLDVEPLNNSSQRTPHHGALPWERASAWAWSWACSSASPLASLVE